MAKTEKKTCSKCTKPKAVSNFYATNSPLFADKLVPLCKQCISDSVDETDLNTVKNILRQIDKPFIWSVWQSCVESDKDTFGWYMRQINSLPQYKTMTYEDSVGELKKAEREMNLNRNNVDDIDELETEHGSIEITKEIKAKFGSGYSNLEYLKMEQFYQDMIASHDITTPQHKLLLTQLCKLNIKLNTLLEEGQYGEYAKLSKTYDDILKSSGFRPVDRKSTDEASGIRTFSQIFEEVERDGFIKPADPNFDPDEIDKAIMYMANYNRRLFNMQVLHEAEDLTGIVHDGKEEDDE